MTKAKDLLHILAEFEESPESVGIDLRLDLADLVIRHLDGQGWTQKQLAQRTGMQESFISRIIHAESNCTFEVAGRIMHALGVRVQLRETLLGRQQFLDSVFTAGSDRIPLQSQEATDGQESSRARIFRVREATTQPENQRLRLAKTG